MNQGEMDYQPAVAAQSRAGLGLLLLLSRAMPWLVFFAVCTLSASLPESLNPTPARLGWLAGSFFLPAALLSAWTTSRVQKKGPRHVLVLAFLVTACSLMLISSVPTLEGACAGMALGGIALAFAQPSSRLAAVAHSEAEIRPWMLLLVQAGMPVAAILAGAVLPPQVGHRSWSSSLSTWVPLVIFMAVLVRVWIPPDDPRDRIDDGQREAHSHRRTPWMLVLADTLIGAAFAICLSWLGLYASKLGLPQNGMTPMMIAMGGAGLAILGGLAWISFSDAETVFTRRQNLAPALMLACGGIAIALLPLATAEQRLPLWAGAAGIGIALFASHEVLLQLLSPEYPPDPEAAILPALLRHAANSQNTPSNPQQAGSPLAGTQQDLYNPLQGARPGSLAPSGQGSAPGQEGLSGLQSQPAPQSQAVQMARRRQRYPFGPAAIPPLTPRPGQDVQESQPGQSGVDTPPGNGNDPGSQHDLTSRDNPDSQNSPDSGNTPSSQNDPGNGNTPGGQNDQENQNDPANQNAPEGRNVPGDQQNTQADPGGLEKQDGQEKQAGQDSQDQPTGTAREAQPSHDAQTGITQWNTLGLTIQSIPNVLEVQPQGAHMPLPEHRQAPEGDTGAGNDASHAASTAQAGTGIPPAGTATMDAPTVGTPEADRADQAMAATAGSMDTASTAAADAAAPGTAAAASIAASVTTASAASAASGHGPAGTPPVASSFTDHAAPRTPPSDPDAATLIIDAAGHVRLPDTGADDILFPATISAPPDESMPDYPPSMTGEALFGRMPDLGEPTEELANFRPRTPGDYHPDEIIGTTPDTVRILEEGNPDGLIVVANPSVTQLIIAHLLGAAVGPLALGELAGTLDGLRLIWWGVAGGLAVASLLCLLQRRVPAD